ncbi:MAG: flagellar biosynthesis anti-sigma factor FlgM [Bacillota bacterium]|jgi:flagellar biosynthesis anti-sigma factor FlgM|nr:flagellar biosynthesis anti-sigma factor FlgM [Clostridia bacterium]
MKIERTSILPLGKIQPSQKVGKIEKNKNIPSNQDEVKVSTDGQVFQRLLEKAQALPDIREDKVKMFQEQISRGEFNLDSESIAESLLSKNTEDK